MKWLRLGLALLCCFVCPYSHGQSDASAEKLTKYDKKAKLLVDTDAGADDAVALLYLLGAEKVKRDIRIIGITCANGNTAVDNVVINVLKTLKTVDRLDIPVYRGCEQPILKEAPSDNYFGVDGFGDFEFKDPPSPSLAKSRHAVHALINAVRKNPGQITLLCLAPLTNIAMAIRLYPKFLAELKEVYILGGSVEGKGSMRPGIEFNFYIDPEAVAVVLNSAEKLGKKITVIPSETFLDRGRIPMDWRLNTLGSLNTSSVQLINKAETKVLKGDWWEQADQFLAAVAINNSLITRSVTCPVNMETCGHYSRGALFVDYNHARDNATVRIVQEIDMKTYKKLTLKYFSV